jgi:hypothetical protein
MDICINHGLKAVIVSPLNPLKGTSRLPIIH